MSASALSRSVRLLESNLGIELFLRVGTRLELTESGVKFLQSVRDGMRGIHDGMLAARQETLDGLVRISSLGAVTTVAVVPALLDLRSKHPGLRGSIITGAAEEVPSALLTGQLDLALQTQPVESPGIESTLLGQLHHGVYAGKNHPTVSMAQPELERAINEQVFVCPLASDSGTPADGWPVDRPRKVGLEVDQMRVGAEVCAGGSMLAVLPDLLVARLGLPLERLDLNIVAPTPIFAASRQGLGAPSRARVVLDAITARLLAD